jgi:1-aminocyclopropane-1-carboxylate deaminase
VDHSLLTTIKETPLQPLNWKIAKEHGVEVWIKRADLVHPACPGNKWYKLIYNLIEHDVTPNHLISFGGAYSNHIHALAQVGDMLGITTTAFIRGDYSKNLTPTLIDCRDLGMELIFLTRKEWARRESMEFERELKNRYENSFLIPEGGANSAGVKGCVLIGQSIKRQWSQQITSTKKPEFSPAIQVYLACGTGTTLAGVVGGLDSRFDVHGISVLKGEDSLTSKVSKFIGKAGIVPNLTWKIHQQYHCGGYARINDDLVEFIKTFEKEHQILLDPIYTAKVLFAIKSRIERGIIREGEKVIAIHTGGIQGRRGFDQLS